MWNKIKSDSHETSYAVVLKNPKNNYFYWQMKKLTPILNKEYFNFFN